MTRSFPQQNDQKVDCQVSPAVSVILSDISVNNAVSVSIENERVAGSCQ